MKNLLIVLLLLANNAHQAQSAQEEVKETELHECYNNFPFFLKAIAMISDKDFDDEDKSKIRLLEIEDLYRNNEREVENCLAKIMKFSKDNNDIENQKYIEHRMAEVKAVIEKYNLENEGHKTPSGNIE